MDQRDLLVYPAHSLVVPDYLEEGLATHRVVTRKDVGPCDKGLDVLGGAVGPAVSVAGT